MAYSREDAWKLLSEWTKSESLLRHAQSVEASMRWYAHHFHEDEELWGNTGLLHDFDYELHPTADEHPAIGMAYLREHGWPEEMIHAIAGHAPYLGVSRESMLDKALFAVDELSGLIIAVAYSRPNRLLNEVEVKSVMKKLKDASFARAVSREDVALGAEELGLTLEDHVGNCLIALQGASAHLGM